MPLLRSCCGCISLKTGTIICGVLGIVTAIISAIILLTNPVKVKTIVFEDLPPIYVKIIICINLIFTVLISVLLIIGAIKRKTWYMLPWVIIALMLVGGLIISVIYTTVEFFVKKETLSGIFTLVFGLILLAIHIYLWLVGFSYYQLVKEEKRRGFYKRPMA